MIRFLAFMLAACGPIVRVEAVDDETKPVLDALIADLLAVDSRAVGYDRPGVTLLVDTERLSQHNVEYGSCAAGVYESANDVVYMASVNDWARCSNGNTLKLTAGGAKLVLAHELGHVAGLQHKDSGLMAPFDTSCLGTEAACLARELAQR